MSPDATVSGSTSPTSPRPARVRWAQRGFVLFGGVFTICVAIQVFIAGMAVFVDPSNWNLHTTFVHAFELLPWFMLVMAFVGRLSRRLKLLSILLWVLIGIQYATASMFGSLVAAIHPVNALAMFWLAVATTRWAWRDTVS